MTFFKKITELLFPSEETRLARMANQLIEQTRVIELTADGFTITSAGPRTITYQWREIDAIKSHGTAVTVYVRGQLAVTLDPEYNNFYEWVQNVPKGYQDFDYAFFQDFFHQLSGCPCCGLIAMHGDECLACGFESWNDSLLEEYDSETEYLKEEQLLIFDPVIGEAPDIHNRPEQGFKSDASWKPLISAEDFEE